MYFDGWLITLSNSLTNFVTVVTIYLYIWQLLIGRFHHVGVCMMYICEEGDARTVFHDMMSLIISSLRGGREGEDLLAFLYESSGLLRYSGAMLSNYAACFVKCVLHFVPQRFG